MIDFPEVRYLKKKIKKLNQPLKIPRQPSTISKQSRIPKGNLLASPMFPLFKNWNMMNMDRAEIIPNKFYTDNSMTFCKTQLMKIYTGNKKRKDEEQKIIPCRLVETNASNRNERVFSLHFVILQRIYSDTQNSPERK